MCTADPVPDSFPTDRDCRVRRIISLVVAASAVGTVAPAGASASMAVGGTGKYTTSGIGLSPKLKNGKCNPNAIAQQIVFRGSGSVKLP